MKQFILCVVYAIMYFMRKLRKDNLFDSLNKSLKLKYILLNILIIAASAVFLGCLPASHDAITPSPQPTYTAAPTSTSAPAVNSLSSPQAMIITSGNATPLYDESYPVPEIVGNTGANIENGGLSASDNNYIYYVDNGIWRMNKSGSNPVLITDMQNVSCLNNVDGFIYFLSSHDGTIYKVEKTPNAVPISLNISGASNLIIIDEYMYYSSTAGEGAPHYIYKSPLHGIIMECLFIQADYITPDGAYFYYSNLEDDNTLWRYDTISSQTVKITNDNPSQINIFGDKIYYISENSDYNVVCIDRNGLNQVVVVTQGCTDLNFINNYLIYRTIDTGYIQSYNIKTGDKVTLVSYGDLYSLSTTDSMIFFQSSIMSGLEPETYVFDLVTSKLNKPLPQKIYALVRNINAEEMYFEYDRVDFYLGEDAVKNYASHHSTTLEDAKEAVTTDEGAYYIYNKQPAWLRVLAQDWTHITLIRRLNSPGDKTPYTANLAEIETLFNNKPELEGKLIFELTIIDKKVVEMKEVYYTINTDN